MYVCVKRERERETKSFVDQMQQGGIDRDSKNGGKYLVGEESVERVKHIKVVINALIRSRRR